jgi:hypothetical protein
MEGREFGIPHYPLAAHDENGAGDLVSSNKSRQQQ